MRPLLVLLVALLAGAEIELRAPLTTLVDAPGTGVVTIQLVVPPDAPADLGLGAFTADRDGRWWQRSLRSPLKPGIHHLSVDLSGRSPLVAEPLPASWDAGRKTSRAGIFFWSAGSSHARISVTLSNAEPASPATPARLTQFCSDASRLRCGERWTMSCVPDPVPADPGAFPLSLEVADPEGRQFSISGFWREPMRPVDGGDRELMQPAGAARCELRYRPCRPGTYRLTLIAGGCRLDLPPLQVDGPAVDPFVRVDRDDPRFFAVDGRLWWPIGLNLNSTFDKRSQEVNQTRLTPARGSLTYAAILDRLAAAGGDACEIWMSSWNLGLEWRADWPGYGGIGRWNLANAERLDLVLDHAWKRGIRVNLVLNNHGQASPNSDREWKDNPWNQVLGGPLAKASELFTDERALAGQDHLRRYIVARWADHPAVMGWKLYSEIDLTAGTSDTLTRWHERAAADFRAIDIYGHPVTTHWAGDYRRVDARIAALPGIGYVCIDAYRRGQDARDARLLAELLAGSTIDPMRGLHRFSKPVLTTEFGAGSGAAPEDFRSVDHLTGAWAGLVSGHAGAPMLWWWEWVDQDNRWEPYGAIRRFVTGEELRGADARSVELTAEANGRALWCRSWVRPGRLLGYLLEPQWGARGGEPPRIDGAEIEIGQQVAVGRVRVSWWDAANGRQVVVEDIAHPGGRLVLKPPAFSGHIAFKLQRLEFTPADP